MPAKFDGQNIFGSLTRQTGMAPRHRWQEEHVPGIGGSRVYDLGADGAVWQIRGRIVTTSPTYGLALNACVDAVMAGASYHNGGLYTFTDAGGNSYDNCLLVSYQQAGEYQTCDYNGQPACTVVVTATVRWMLPA